MMGTIREPAVAGQFYPRDPAILQRTVGELLTEAGCKAGPPPKALVVPHAGYIYSGPVAASAYGRLAAHHDRYRRVVLLGPCHRLPVKGLALTAATAFRTPMGDVAVDTAVADLLAGTDVRIYDATHTLEHSLEVQLPFLQAVLDDFELVPIVVGDATPEDVADVLEVLWDGPETLIVVSSDLSHYQRYKVARMMDNDTRAAIERLDADYLNHERACGATPIAGLLLAARRHGLRVRTIDVRNSGDTAGDRQVVVGYGAWEFGEPDNTT